MRCADRPNKMPRSNSKKLRIASLNRNSFAASSNPLHWNISREAGTSGNPRLCSDFPQTALAARLLHKTPRIRSCASPSSSSVWTQISTATELTDSVPGSFCCCKLLINNGNWRFTKNIKSWTGPSLSGPNALRFQSQPFLDWMNFALRPLAVKGVRCRKSRQTAAP